MTTLLAPFVGLILAQSTPTTQDAASNPVPEILEKAFMYRTTFKTARFTLRIEKKRRLLQPWVRRFQFLWAHGARHIVDLGDDHGLRQNGDGDEVHLGTAHFAEPRSYFMNAADDELWSYWRGRVDHLPPGISKDSRYDWFPDPRPYGLICGDMMPVGPEKFLESFRDPKGKFVVSDSSPGCVHARYIGPESGRGHSETEWWIDIARGPSVTQVRQSYARGQQNPEVFADLTSTVELIDGYWWPIRIEGPQGYFGKDQTCVVTFENVEFDRSNHPQSLDADVLKIPLGTKVWRPTKTGDPFERIRYSGHGKVITEEEWLKKTDKYDIRAMMEAERRLETSDAGYCPDWWEVKNDLYGLKDVARQPELWDIYVRRWALKRRKNALWIVANPLTDDQCRRAQAVLDDCQKKVVSATQDEIEAIFLELKQGLRDTLTRAQRDPDNAGWHELRLRRMKRPVPKPRPVYPWNAWPGGPGIV